MLAAAQAFHVHNWVTISQQSKSSCWRRRCTNSLAGGIAASDLGARWTNNGGVHTLSARTERGGCEGSAKSFGGYHRPLGRRRTTGDDSGTAEGGRSHGQAHGDGRDGSAGLRLESGFDARARIQKITQCVTDEVERQNGEHHGECRENDEMRSIEEVRASVVQHRTPTCGWRRHPEA